MKRRLWFSLSLVSLAAGAALLVAAATAGSAAEAPKGGTLRLARFSDVDFVDPALAYQSWSWTIVCDSAASWNAAHDP